jgi:hypothetical protein
VFRAISLLLFLPSVTFGLISAEVFPWGVIFAAFHMRSVSRPMLLLVGIMFASCFYALAALIIDGGTLETDVIRSLAAYMNVILVSCTLLSLGKNRAIEICLLSKKIFWGLIALGLIQTLGSDMLGSFIQLLVPRGEGSALVESNRGVTLFATEPARAGIELTLIYLISRLTSEHNRNTLIMDLFLIVFIALIIKSASAVAFAIGAFAIIHFKVKANIITLFSTLVLTSILGFFVISILPTMGGRAGDLVASSSDMGSLGQILFYLANESGNRLLALYSFSVSGLYHPLGFGIGSWPYSSMIAVQESGLDFHDFRFFEVRGDGHLIPFRGPGVISNLLLDVGIIGVISLFVLFKRSMLEYGTFNSLSKKAFWIFFFKISLFGSPGNPIVFIFFITVFLVLSSRIDTQNISK